MRSRTKRVAGFALACLVVPAGGGFVFKAKGDDDKAAVPAEQVIASIRTAVAAKPGNVRAVETETEGGKTVCEVEILAEDGKTYEVEVDVATNAVVEVEEDND
jgi:uncharacterized membrane protein YkoI